MKRIDFPTRHRFVPVAVARPLLAICLLVSFAAQAQVIVVRPGARPPGRPPAPVWQDLGTTVVSFGVNRDAVNVFEDDFFRALKFKVWDASLEMLEAEVVYGNGSRDRVPINAVVRRGEESPALNLRGGQRRIRKVFFTYRFLPGFTGRRAKITLFGIR